MVNKSIVNLILPYIHNLIYIYSKKLYQFKGLNYQLKIITGKVTTENIVDKHKALDGKSVDLLNIKQKSTLTPAIGADAIANVAIFASVFIGITNKIAI